MEIRDRKSIQGVGAVHAGAPVRQAHAAPAAGVGPARDVLAVGGIPEAELTPNVVRALTALMAEVEQLRHELEDARSRIGYLEKLVDEDPLMPVVNRRAFLRELSRMMSFAQRYGVAASIVYFDVDNLKQINDTYGHSAGDVALVQVAKILVENVRTTDVVGRLGGDEMGVLLMQSDRPVAERKAAELAERIAKEEVKVDGAALHVTVSWGVHELSQGDSAGAVIEAADRAMYQLKTASRVRAK
ncbi:MAG TPA: GGDEF domain-containing protein [Stellaceae bacterium]|nr:GGDEF domain-containing protein [Stellaceae bacterium]